MEAVHTSETSVDNHFTRQYNPEDSSEQKLMKTLFKGLNKETDAKWQQEWWQWPQYKSISRPKYM
jgi:hypothetical protein